MFGDNTEVPLPTVVTHRDGQALLDALNNVAWFQSEQMLLICLTDLAEPFELPRIGVNRPPEEATAFDDSDEDEHEVSRPSKRRHTRVVDEHATSSQTSNQ